MPIKRKRRRLKKRVRLGCIALLLLPFLFICGYACRYVYGIFGGENSNDIEALDTIECVLGTDNVDVAMNVALANVVSHPERIDTTQLAVSVWDLQQRCSVFRYRADVLMPPASCMKLLTAITALRRIGTDHMYESRMYQYGTVNNGVLNGYVVLQMDDDPLIENFDSMIESLSGQGIHTLRGGVYFDLARRDTLKAHSSASPWDIPYHSLPLLLRGEEAIVRCFRASLAAHGIVLENNLLFGNTWLNGMEGDMMNTLEYRVALHAACAKAKCVAEICHPLRQVLAPMLIFSNNVLAECVFFHTNQHLDRWSGVTTPKGQILNDFISKELFDVPSDAIVVNDGSGLSPDNMLTADFLTGLLTYAYNDEIIRRELMDELLATPCEGYRRGTLSGRMPIEKFEGKVFCKTGTLTTHGVSSLSGFCKGKDGRWYAFAILHRDTPVYESRIFQDRICNVLVTN